MKKIVLQILFLFLWVNAFTQTDIYNKGITITVKSGTTIHINGSLTQAPKDGTHPELVSEGEIHLTGDFDNQTEKNVFTGAGKVVFYGDSAQQIIGDSSIHFHKLVVDKSSNELELAQDIDVSDSLQLTGGNIHLNGYDIELGSSGNLIDETNAKRVYGQDGVLRATRSLSGEVSNIAGLGISIDGNLAGTTIERGHSSQSGASDGGILRYYQLEPDNISATLTSVKFAYLDAIEFNGLEEAKFALWQSDNNAIVWNPLESNPTGTTDELGATNVLVSSNQVLFTIAESTCSQVPIVDLLSDTTYLCLTDTLTLDAGNPGLFYFWSGGENTQTIKLTTEGQYHIAVRDANGCVGYDTIQVISKPYPLVDFDVDFVCQNDTTLFTNNSTISADTMAFHWDFGMTTIETDTTDEAEPNYLYDTTGVYTVKLTATSDYACVTSNQETYVVHPLPELAFTITDECLNATSLFTNTSTILASQGAFTYSITETDWDFGVTNLLDDTSDMGSPSYLYTDADTYEVELIGESNSGCRDTLIKQVTIHPRAIPNFTFTDICAGLDIQLTNSSTLSSGSKSYVWDYGDGLFSSDEDPSKTYPTAGQYDVELKVITDQLCEDSITQQVTIYDIPTADFTIRDTCANATAYLLNASTIASVDGLDYSWSLGDNSNSIMTNPTKSYITEGDYQVKLIVTSDQSCIDSVTKSVTIMPVADVQFSFLNICEGNDVTFQNFSQVTSGSYSSSWDFGNTNSSTLKNPIENYDTSGTYDVVLTTKSSFGCEASLTKAVEVYELPTFNIPTRVGTCVGTYNLDAENIGSTYIWSDNSSDQVFTVTTSGTYSVQVTNANSCVASHQVTVSLNSTFTPNFGDDVAACDEYTLDAGNVGSQSYLWSTGDDTKELTVNQTGEYIVAIVDQNGCDGADTIEVTISTSPVVDLGDDIDFCLGTSGVIDAQNLGSSYLWSNGEVNQTIMVSTAGIYSVKVTTPESCFSSDEIEVVLNTLPIVDLGEDQAVCDSVTLDAQNIGFIFLWSDASEGSTLWADQAGEYWVEVKNGDNCLNRDTINITIAPKPIVDLGDAQTVCSGEQLTLDAANEGEVFEWQNTTDLQTLLVSSTGFYEVQVTNSFNCSASDTVTITVDDQVQVNLGEDVVVCSGQTLDLDVLTEGSSYSWQSDNGFVSIAQTVSLSDSGTYWVSVTTANQCLGIDTVHVAVSKDTVFAEYLAVSLINVGDTVQFVNLSSPDSLTYNWDFADGITNTSEDPQHIFQAAKTYQVSLVVSNEFCSSTVIKDIIVTNLKEEPDADFYEGVYNEIVDAVAYPNPTEGEFTVEVELEKEGVVFLILYDVTGTNLESRTIETDLLEEQFDITNRASAMYLLKVQVGDEVKVLRVVKH